MNYEQMDTWSIGKNEPKTNPNEPKFKKAKMNVTSILTKDYENISNWAICENEPNTNPIQSQSNPIRAQKMPKQTQYKAKQRQLNPISEAKKCCCQGNPHAGHRAGTVANTKICNTLIVPALH